MNTVLELISWLEIEEEEDGMDSKLDKFADLFAEKYGDDHIGVEQYREFRSKASGKTAKSIVISAVARLAPFRASEVKRIFSYDSMELDRLGEEKMAIFVAVPPTDPSFNFIAGMLFTQMFQELQYCASQVHKHDGQRLPVPVRFLLDEFANTCTIPNFTQILAYARSFGIGITPVLQSLEQIKKMYEKEWGTIIDNCNTLLFLGSITHMDTLEYMTKLLGKGTYDKRTYGKSKGKSGSTSTNDDVLGRDLMDPSEIRKLDKKNCILVVGGKNPFYSEKYEYKDHPNYRYTSDANPAYSFTYTPLPPPEKEEEEADIETEVNNLINEIKEEMKSTTDLENILSHLVNDFDSVKPEVLSSITEQDLYDALGINKDNLSEEEFSIVFDMEKILASMQNSDLTSCDENDLMVAVAEDEDLIMDDDEDYEGLLK